MAGAEGGRDLSPRGMLDLIVQARVDVVSGNLALHCALNDQIPHYVTSDQTDNLLDLFLKTAEAFLLDHKAIVNKGDKSIMAEMAMRATYAIVEDTALFAPEKLQDQHYVGELKNLVARYLLRSDSP